MSYNVGDVVVIRPNLTPWSKYDGIVPTEGMTKYSLQNAIITAMTELSSGVTAYHIDIDRGANTWTGSMFCGTREEYERRNDWSKTFTIDMLDDLLQDLEIIVSFESKEDAEFLLTELQKRGYYWLGEDEDEVVDPEDTRWDEYEEETVYWLTSEYVDRYNRDTANTDPDYDYQMKYTFCACPVIDDFEMPSAGALFV